MVLNSNHQFANYFPIASVKLPPAFMPPFLSSALELSTTPESRLPTNATCLSESTRSFCASIRTTLPDWSKIKLTVDKPITWEQYLDIEQRLLGILDQRDRPLEQRMLECSTYLVEKARGVGSAGSNGTGAVDGNGTGAGGGGTSASRSTAGGADKTSGAGAVTAPLKALDLSLLLTFHRMYYPTRQLKVGQGDFRIMALLQQHFGGSKRLQQPKKAYTVEELHAMEWPDDPEINGILDRYFYSYIWGKKYFGAGFGQVSVIAGLHHLILMLCLLKLQSKASARMRDSETVNLLDVASTVRQMERQVGETKLGGYAAAAWELLLFSPGRAKRFLDNC